MNNKLYIAAIIGVSALLVGGLTRASAETITFSYTGSYVPWIVPLEVTSITFHLKGASGGDASGGGWTVYGGQGASLTGTLSVSPGSTLYFFVGGAGVDATESSVLGGFNGGGAGSFHSGGGGGGATDIRVDGISLENRAAVAAGGGGANTVGGYGGWGGDVGPFGEPGGPFNSTLGYGSDGLGGGGGGGYLGGIGGYYGYNFGDEPNAGGGSSFFDPEMVSNPDLIYGGIGSSGTKANGFATITTVPEPSISALLGLTCAAAFVYWRNQKK